MTLIGEAAVRVRPDTSTFRLETQRGVSAALTGLGGLGTLAPLASSLRFTGLAAGIGATAFAAKEAIGSAASLEEELNVLQVTAGATAEEMDRVGQTARDLGSDLRLPGVSATDAASAMLQLTKGGLDVEDSIGGARGVLQLATATNLEFADSAAIVARALTTFQRPGEDATKVADLLVGSAQAATGEVSDVAEALSAGGATAAQFGLSLEETVTQLTLLARNGILGSEAGTGLRRVLLQLVPTTKEQADLFEALGVRAFDLEGRLRPLPDIFQDFQDAFRGLTEETRADVLNKIFGAFGIEAASVFIREGADATRELGEELARGGQAAEVAEARTKGLTGAAANLGSQLETLGTDIGEIAVPALTDLVNALAGAASAADEALESLKDFWNFDPEIVGGFTIGDLTGSSAEAKAQIDQQKELLEARVAARRALKEPLDADAIFGIDLATGRFSALNTLLTGLTGGFEKAEDNAHRAGRETGKKFTGGLSEGIISAEQEAVQAAQSTLAEVIREGREAVAEAIRQGDEAVRLSAISARQNLLSLGNELAGQAVRLIDEGPLAQRIAQLQASLADRQEGDQRKRLREGLRDAQKELEEAEAAVSTGGRPRSREQQERVDEFLTPFQRKVRDAKAALAEFNTEGVISELQEQAEEQKRVVQQGIADLIVQFNQGAISLQQLNVRTAGLLEKNGVVPYGRAGDRLGLAFRETFEAQLAGLREQALEIARGLDVPESGLEPTVISPAGERARQNENIADVREGAARRESDARAALVRAQNANTRSLEDNTDASRDLAREIRAARGLSTPKRGKDTQAPVPVSGR